MYRPLRATNDCKLALLSSLCNNSKWFYFIEDILHITLLSLVISYMCQLLKYLIIPNIFISTVLSTIIWLYIYHDKGCVFHIDLGAIIAVICIPICIFISINLFPFLSFRWLNKKCAMEQYAYFTQNYKYQIDIFQYLFTHKRNKSNMIHAILAINYYFFCKIDGRINTKNHEIKYMIESRNNNGKYLGFKSWSNIRQRSGDRRNYHLLFSFMVNIFVFLYRMYHLLLISYIYIYFYFFKLNINIKYYGILCIFILNIIYKCFIFFKIIIIIRFSFIMFHILFPIDLIYEHLREINNDNSVIEDIQEIENIFISAMAQRHELIRYNQNEIEIGEHIIDVILQYSAQILPIQD